MQSDDDVKNYPCVICGAEAGENCREEDDPTVELCDGTIHVGRWTGGCHLSILKDEDGIWRELDN